MGRIAQAVGSVSSFFGPLDGLHFELSVPLAGAYSYAAMLPTAMAELGIKADSPATNGVFTRKDGVAARFQGEKFSYIPLPQEVQLRLRGVICSVDRIQEDGSCKCDDLREKLDRQLVEQQVEADAKRKAAAREAGTPEEAEEEVSECPLCTFIKGGPCVNEFKVWDACLKESKKRQEAAAAAGGSGEGEAEETDNRYADCLEHMKAMMACMMKHEYYDVFTSRGEDDVEEAAMQEEEEAKKKQKAEAEVAPESPASPGK